MRLAPLLLISAFGIFMFPTHAIPFDANASTPDIRYKSFFRSYSEGTPSDNMIFF